MGLAEIRSPAYRYSGADRRDHRHVIIQWTISGEGVFEFEGQSMRVGPGSGFICQSHDPRGTYYYPKTAKKPWYFFFLQLANAEAAAARIVEEHGPVFTLPDSFNPFLAYERADSRTLASFEDSPVEPTVLAAHALAAIARSHDPVDTTAHPLVRRAWVIIRRSQILGRTLTVAALARQLSITPEHLSRLFRQTAGISPLEAIRQERMQAATLLLRDSSLTIKEVAGRLGFDTSSHFARLFRQVWHLTPQQYRDSRKG
jgi:AraC-like DNA-binding protein